MGYLQQWWRNVTWVSRQSPPRIVEGVMLLLAAIFCVVWFGSQKWQFLLLCLSYILGATASILVRELVTPSTRTWTIRLTVVLLLACLLSSLGFYLSKTQPGLVFIL